MEFLSLSEYSGWILLFARVILGIIMIYYGFPKIRDLKSNSNDFNNKGFRPGILWGSIIAFIEFFGGISIILGIYTNLFLALFSIHMLTGTFWKIFKTKKEFTDWSYDILLLTISLVLLFIGTGKDFLF